MTDGKRPEAGILQDLGNGIARVLAPNPSPMTFWGTNSYLLGDRTVAVIDPGPASPAHLQALLQAIGGRTVTHILVTHSHVDHSPLARPLAEATGAPILAFGDSRAGRTAAMDRLAAQGLAGGGEGADPDFAPDILLADGATLEGDEWRLEAFHTPGHFGNHLCLRHGDDLFSGDHVMGWATSLVSPPDGDLTDFMASTRRLTEIGAARALPGHGDPVEALDARLRWLIDHRLGREVQILAALASGPATCKALTAAIYTDVTPALLPAAARNVFAHLVDLVGRGAVTAAPELSVNATFSKA
jgi:glyoxylase-like metal-dependent hydrolase (beta-lactamase superfamily II)